MEVNKQKKVSELLEGVEILNTIGDIENSISSIHFDSREVLPGSMFVAINGNADDGSKFIDDAVKNGATVIVHEAEIISTSKDILYVRVVDTRSTLAIIAHNYYGNPTNKLKVVGVTGTNGKTTTVTLLFQLFRSLGFKVALISTVENKINENTYPTSHTTPDPIKIAHFLSLAVQEECSYVFMECSSHAIHQKRILGIKFTGCIFTNLTHDHLDYHKTLESYAKAKKELFDTLPKDSFALGNIDDAQCEYILSDTKAEKYFFCIKKDHADFRGEIKEQSLKGLSLYINSSLVETKLVGNFNVYNIIAIFSAAKLLGIQEDKIISSIRTLEPPTGRLEFIKLVGIYGVVDYAHSPDALSNVLMTLKEVKSDDSKIITVVGCGGDRDKTKRSIMGQIACELSDKVYFTSDNPRSENPETILEDMIKDLKPEVKNYEKVADRALAIQLACKNADQGDIVLIAGKGHETYQIFKDQTIHFSDMEELRKNLS